MAVARPAPHVLPPPAPWCWRLEVLTRADYRVAAVETERRRRHPLAQPTQPKDGAGEDELVGGCDLGADQERSRSQPLDIVAGGDPVAAVDRERVKQG